MLLAITTTGVPMGIWDELVDILAIYPFYWTSNPTVALSVSTSHITSPTSTRSPSLTFHLSIFPYDIVGERAGI